jgi:two-component system, sensor histidine kinase
LLFLPSELARSALDAAPDAMLIIDGSGVIRFVNRQVSALFGYAHDELIGERVEVLLPERFRGRHIALRNDYMGNARVRPMGPGLALFGRRGDGSEFPVEISLSPIADGDRTLVAAAIRDVSDRKRIEAELVAAREAADVAREAAEAARETADRANMGKSRFLATASHDLRQPLQTLSLLSGTLRRSVVDADAVEILGHQEQAIGAMSRLLNALLDISKLESGAVKPDPSDFSVNALFEELRREFADLAASRGLSLKVIPCEVCVFSDRMLVEQILKNLLSNAIKYTRQGWVTLRGLYQQPSQVRIDVMDTGVGIPTDQLRYIYDEFYQVGVPTNSSREGYGLGLSIVQRIVALLDLRLEVQSELGKGSLFSLTLPTGHVVGATQERRGTQLPPPRATGPSLVLLVEDDASVRNATRMLLKAEGYEVAAVASLAEAVGRAKQDPPVNLIAADYHLSDGETGIQVIAAVREAMGIPLKAVLVTGDTSAAVRDLPADPHLRIVSKPIRAEELLDVLRALLSA